MSCHPSSRREMLALLGAGALIPTRWTRAAETGLHFEALDHVGITVSDPQKSATFYARIFGGAVYKNHKSTQRYLKLGPTYISIRQAGPQSKGYGVDHICPGIPSFDGAAVKAALQAKGVSAREIPGFGLFAGDPDGILVQVMTRR